MMEACPPVWPLLVSALLGGVIALAIGIAIGRRLGEPKDAGGSRGKQPN